MEICIDHQLEFSSVKDGDVLVSIISTFVRWWKRIENSSDSVLRVKEK